MGGIKRFLPRTTRTVKSAQDAGPRVQAPMRFLLAPVVCYMFGLELYEGRLISPEKFQEMALVVSKMAWF